MEVVEERRSRWWDEVSRKKGSYNERFKIVHVTTVAKFGDKVPATSAGLRMRKNMNHREKGLAQSKNRPEMQARKSCSRRLPGRRACS
jgi:hypothetical protein